MAKTFARLLIEAQTATGSSTDQALGVPALDDAFRFFWDAHPWRDSLGDLPPFYTIPKWQRYEEPYIQFPSDLVDLFSAEIVTLGEDGVQSVSALDPVGNLDDETTTVAERQPSIGYSYRYNAFMLSSPVPFDLGRAYVVGKYKKDYPFVLDGDALGNTFPMTRHERTFLRVLKWAIRGMPPDQLGSVQLALQHAFISEAPGRQYNIDAPDSAFAALGG